MPKTIKITKEQLQEIDNSFNYFSNNNETTPYDGQKNVYSNGKIDGEENGEPKTSDDIQKMFTPQTYARFRSYGTLRPSHMRESTDKNNDGIDDFYNHEEMDILSNGKSNDNIMRVPHGIDTKTQLLIDAIKTENLNPKQQAMVLNKIIENLNLKDVPFGWKKELILKLKKNNK